MILKKFTNIEEVKKHLDLDNSDIAKMFGYKNAMSYSNTTKKEVIEKALVEMANKFESRENTHMLGVLSKAIETKLKENKTSKQIAQELIEDIF